ncbi:hypothetical protein ACPWT1_08500 [Ramlibacter sp. MMS24-I3-19]
MNTVPRTPGRSRSRGGVWLYVLTWTIVVASFGAALLLILLTP